VLWQNPGYISPIRAVLGAPSPPTGHIITQESLKIELQYNLIKPLTSWYSDNEKIVILHFESVLCSLKPIDVTNVIMMLITTVYGVMIV